MQLTIGVSEELFEQFKRVQDPESQRTQKPIDYETTLQALVKRCLDQNDPLRKTQPKLVARLVNESLKSK